MPLRAVQPEEMTEQFRARYEANLKAAGEARFLQAALAAPHMLDWYTGSFYAQVFRGGTVPLRIKELMRLRLSHLHGCVT